MTAMTTIKDVYDLLRKFNITRNYKGYDYAAYAIWLTVQDATRVQLVTKWLYPDVAANYGVEPSKVERNIRTLVSVICDEDPEAMHKVLGIKLAKKPTNARFIALMSDYLLREENARLEEMACNT